MARVKFIACIGSSISCRLSLRTNQAGFSRAAVRRANGCVAPRKLTEVFRKLCDNKADILDLTRARFSSILCLRLVRAWMLFNFSTVLALAAIAWKSNQSMILTANTYMHFLTLFNVIFQILINGTLHMTVDKYIPHVLYALISLYFFKIV